MSVDTVPDELLSTVPRGICHDPETGECSLLYSLHAGDDAVEMAGLGSQLHGERDGTRTRFYAHLSPSMVARLSVGGDGGGRTIHLVDTTYERRVGRRPFGQTELERFALLDRMPKFATREALEDALCASIGREAILRTFGHEPVLQEVADLVVDRPSRLGPIACDLDELLAMSVDDWRGPAPPGIEPAPAIREVIRRKRRREGGEAGYLRRLLGERRHVAALADVGIVCELRGDDVRLSFTDPCHEHRRRLGREEWS